MCGVVAHDSCSRRVPDDCRPVAEVCERMVHEWRPAGVVLRDREVGKSASCTCLGPVSMMVPVPTTGGPMLAEALGDGRGRMFEGGQSMSVHGWRAGVVLRDQQVGCCWSHHC